MNNKIKKDISRCSTLVLDFSSRIEDSENEYIAKILG